MGYEKLALSLAYWQQGIYPPGKGIQLERAEMWKTHKGSQYPGRLSMNIRGSPCSFPVSSVILLIKPLHNILTFIC